MVVETEPPRKLLAGRLTSEDEMLGGEFGDRKDGDLLTLLAVPHFQTLNTSGLEIREVAVRAEPDRQHMEVEIRDQVCLDRGLRVVLAPVGALNLKIRGHSEFSEMVEPILDPRIVA